MQQTPAPRPQKMVPLLLLLVLVPGAVLQEECQGSSCNPQLGDLMVGRAAQLSASSTCGLDGPQNYCIIGYLEEEQKCFTCDSREPYDRQRNPDSHPVENVITIFDPERKMRWWQSEPGVNQVSIQLNLETLFQFSHLVLTFKSFRPAAMLVERSKDFGRTWKVFRYFAEDCAAHFPWVSAEPSDGVDDVVCDSRYSGSQPSTDGEVVLKALDPIYDIEDPYAPNIQELITLTNIRVNFTRLFTLGDTLRRKRRDPQDKYYYALYDMVVRGSCFCHGHASMCMPVDGSRGDAFNEPGMVHGRCVCQHNTAGDNCERCQDIYNDAPWRPGNGDQLNACRRCNCHGHSELCRFDAARYDATGQTAGGVCVDCRNDRQGPRCELCKPFHYQDPYKALEDPTGCIPCDCDPVGSQGGGLCESATGQCVCKENVGGQRCDRCKYGFYGLRGEDPEGCQMCRCNSLGSVPAAHQCDQETGACDCEPLAIAPYCDQCLPGYWGLGNTVHRCSPCDCDSGGAKGNRCSAEDGKCDCLPNMAGRRCDDPAPGYFLPPLDYFLYEAEFASPLRGTESSPLVNPARVYPTQVPDPVYPDPVYPDPVYPIPVYPDQVTPDPVYPDPVYPIPVYPDQVTPDPVYPEPVYPDPVYPDPVYPEPVYPEPVYPDQVTPYPVYPDPVYPDPVYPDQVTPYPVYPDQVTPYPVYPDQVTPYPVYPDPVYPDPVYPDQVTPDPVYPDPVYPDQVNPDPVNPSALPKCENYYREQGFDFKFSNGRLVLVRRTRRQARRRRQGQRTLSLEPGGPLQIVPRQRTPDKHITWTGPGFVRALDGAGLRFTVDNLPSSIDYQLVVRYESESPDDWLATISIVPLTPGEGSCPSDPTGTRTLRLPGNSRSAILDHPVCLNAGGRYFVDITFKKEQNIDPRFSSHILIDSMGLIPRIESVQDLCSENDLDSYRRFRCVGLAAEAGPQEEIPEECESLVKSLSARINGAVACRCNPQGSVGTTCSKLGGLCECKPNVIGRCCETCAPLTYGFGPTGCEACACDPRGSLSELCDQVRGQCACRREVTGRSCDRCQPGYWGFPLCRPCQCNGLAELCDPDSGACLQCRHHATGDSCERCEDGYLGDPVSREPCLPCLCPDAQGSERFFASSCDREPEASSLTCNCLQGHTGPLCDSCSAGFHGDLTDPAARCEPCPCNGNIDPDDAGACDRVSGECLRCLHHTQGAHCQQCRPGYYGNALEQDCKECSCDRRGTEVTQCPLDSPCFCHQQGGQCPCRPGAGGPLCDECADGYWNIGGPSGCQPCNCDAANSLSNVCDKVTGQCVCSPEFGGRQCDECGENHFGNPDEQCMSCDCNMEGAERPACERDTGDCLCRVGVTGIFCDECAQGFQSAFPACAPCHHCAALWRHNVSDVQQAAKTMRAVLPSLEGRPRYMPLAAENMTRMESDLERLANLTAEAPPTVMEVEELCRDLSKLKDRIDPNLILLDPTPLLNTEIEDIRRGFTKLIRRLENQVPEYPDEREDEEELMEEIVQLHKEFLAEEKRVQGAEKALEDSIDTRQALKGLEPGCGSKGNLSEIVDQVNGLDVLQLNEAICGAPGHRECSKSQCGGALCTSFWGTKLCGGPSCNGTVPLSLHAKKKAGEAESAIGTMLDKLREAGRKTNSTKQVALDTLDLSANLQDRIKNQKEDVEREKQKAKDLLKLVKDYLMDELVAPEDIEKMAQAVLDIRLPASPEQILSLIQKITDLLPTTTVETDLSGLDEKAKVAKDLLQQALALKNRTQSINVKHITDALYAAEQAQDKAENILQDVAGNMDSIRDTVPQVNRKLEDAERALMSGRPPGDILRDTLALRDKTQLNREQAGQATKAAGDALTSADQAAAELDQVNNKFNELKDKIANQNASDAADKLLKDLITEAESVKANVENKMQQIQDLERTIQDIIDRKAVKAQEVAQLLEQAEELRESISEKAKSFSAC